MNFLNRIRNFFKAGTKNQQARVQKARDAVSEELFPEQKTQFKSAKDQVHPFDAQLRSEYSQRVREGNVSYVRNDEGRIDYRKTAEREVNDKYQRLAREAGQPIQGDKYLLDQETRIASKTFRETESAMKQEVREARARQRTIAREEREAKKQVAEENRAIREKAKAAAWSEKLSNMEPEKRAKAIADRDRREAEKLEAKNARAQEKAQIARDKELKRADEVARLRAWEEGDYEDPRDDDFDFDTVDPGDVSWEDADVLYASVSFNIPEEDALRQLDEEERDRLNSEAWRAYWVAKKRREAEGLYTMTPQLAALKEEAIRNTVY